MATTVFVFADLIASDFERQLCINGMNAPLSLLIAEVKPPATKRCVTDAGPARLSCAASNNVAVLRAIIIRGDRLKAAALGISASVASGMLLGAVQFLVDYFKALEDAEYEEQKL